MGRGEKETPVLNGDVEGDRLLGRLTGELKSMTIDASEEIRLGGNLLAERDDGMLLFGDCIGTICVKLHQDNNRYGRNRRIWAYLKAFHPATKPSRVNSPIEGA